jgi:small conductance mechanosensitive channel
MFVALEPFEFLFNWLVLNLVNILSSLISIIVIYVFFKISTRQITRLKDERKLGETVSFFMLRIAKWSSALLMIAVVIAQFGIRVDLIVGLLVLAGGTVVGFAATNTLGNAIAGLILMTSKPFNIGDRVFFEGRFADVEAIDMIYTRIKTTNNVLISIPNQTLIQKEVENYGKEQVIRRQYPITAGYEEDPENVKAVLIQAANHVESVLGDPEPYVWMTEFQNFSVEYTLSVFISDVKRILEIDSAVRCSIFKSCEEHGIDISTPSLVRSIK